MILLLLLSFPVLIFNLLLAFVFAWEAFFSILSLLILHHFALDAFQKEHVAGFILFLALWKSHCLLLGDITHLHLLQHCIGVQ